MQTSAVVMARSWPEYLDGLTAYLDAIRRALAVGFSSVPPIPERPLDAVPEDCVERVTALHEECERIMVAVSAHMVELSKRSAAYPSSPHGHRSSAYIETDL